MGMAPHSLSFWVPPQKKMKVGTSPRPRPVTFFQVMACVDASHFGHRAVELTEIIGTAHLPLRCLHPSHPTSWGVRCVGNLRSCSDRDNLWDGVKIPWWVLVVPPVYNGADCSFFANSSSPNRPFFFLGFHPNFPNKIQGHRLTVPQGSHLIIQLQPLMPCTHVLLLPGLSVSCWKNINACDGCMSEMEKLPSLTESELDQVDVPMYQKCPTGKSNTRASFLFCSSLTRNL